MTGIYVPAVSGMYNLHIENTCTLASSILLYHYIDNISIKPAVPDLDLPNINISSKTGGTATFDIDAGIANGGKSYWLWMSVSGNYPGIKVSGMTVPLNWDGFLQFGLCYPNFPGSTGFIGKLDFFGIGQAQLTMPPDPQQLFMDVPFHFAYVLTAPGPELPVSYVSTPVHIKYVPWGG
ncbi:MAG: hypothetical protein ACYTG7_14060 [Planctomycetota bacterium]